ncbi:uncharacterized protein DNG_01384 [Cephalotrichum gorgonifer]|uniref:DUF2423 domain-containing protein n=1 Tax=Cephalotrichum gorgonifer TaxID=2041049 RepID=A0AAE8MQW2_9PEZI|nr:uncharacterized protein DNG_01384 [Cephalotrichum gorgonifer]
MARGLRSNARKANNRKLKANVFGPVEDARAERLSAKLMEVANQPKPIVDAEMKTDDLASDDGVDSPKQAEESEAMDVDSAQKTLSATQRALKKNLERRRKTKSRIVFTKYKDMKKRKGKGKA